MKNSKIGYQGLTILFAVCASVTCAFVPNSFAQKGSEDFRTYHDALTFFKTEDKFQNFVRQCVQGLDSTFCPDEPETFEPEGDIYALKCEEFPQVGDQDPQDPPAQQPTTAQNNSKPSPKFIHIDLNTINNNTVFGAAQALKLEKKPGDDLSGWTYGSQLSATTDVGTTQTVGLRASNNLFVRQAVPDLDVLPQNKDKVDYKNYISELAKMPVQYLNVNSIELLYTNSDFKGFNFEGWVGVEFLNTTSTHSKKVVGPRTMNAWHQMLRRTRLDKEIKDVQLISSHGTPDDYKPTAEEKSNQILSYYPFAPLEELPTTRYVVSANIGKKVEIVRGRCTVEFKTGGTWSADKEHVFGPNSFVHTSAEVTGNAFQTNKGFSRVTGSTDGALVYFPRASTPGASKVGFNRSFTVATNHSIGKNANSVQFFFRMMYRGGAQPNAIVDDKQKLSTIGMKWKIQRKK